MPDISETKPKRRMTEAQKAASRANGARSRGPASSAGKQTSSRNALKHGLFARVLTISEADASLLERMTAAYAARLTPRDTLEQDTLTEFSFYKFQIRQTWRMHSATLQMRMALDYEEVDRHWAGVEPIERQALAVQASLADNPSLLLFERYLRMYSTLADRSLNTLMRLRAERLTPDFPIDLPPVPAFDAPPEPPPPSPGPELPNEPGSAVTPDPSTPSEPSGVPANPAPPEPARSAGPDARPVPSTPAPRPTIAPNRLDFPWRDPG